MSVERCSIGLWGIFRRDSFARDEEQIHAVKEGLPMLVRLFAEWWG